MAKKASEENNFKKVLLEEIQSQASGGLKRVAKNEILLTPFVDVLESSKDYKMIFSLPGLGKEDIDVRVEDGELIVEEKRSEGKKPADKIIVKETEQGRYYRKFSLSSEIDQNNVKGTLDKGILSLSLKKLKDVKSEDLDSEEEKIEKPKKAAKKKVAKAAKTKSAAKKKTAKTKAAAKKASKSKTASKAKTKKKA